MRYTTRIIVPPKIRRSGLPGGKDNRYAPQVIGIRKSFGFGDWLGLAGPGHVRAASAHRDWAPFFAQVSPAETALDDRGPQELLRAALRAVDEGGYRQPWGADANRLKTPFEVEAMAEAGFTLFTINPPDLLDDAADQLSAQDLSARIATMVMDGSLPENWSEPYLDRSIELSGDRRLELTLEPLQRAAVKFGPAIQHCLRMYEALTRAQRGRSFEIEVCMDETERAATALEHLFVGLELEARGLRATSLALRYVGSFGTGVDFPGDLGAFEDQLREHVAVAQFCGPYKLSVHGGSDKFGVYPILGRICGEQLHLKTAGSSNLEGLRVIARIDPGLFMEVARYGCRHFAGASASRSVSTAPGLARGLGGVSPAEAESVFLDDRAGRQMLLATHGSLLTEGRTQKGRPLREALVETLTTHADMYHEIVADHFGKHFSSLGAG